MNTHIVERIGLVGSQGCSSFQILRGLIDLLLAGVEHSQVVIGLRTVGFKFQGATQQFFRVRKISFPAVKVSEIRQRDGIIWAQEQGLLEVADSLVRMTLLGIKHPKIVPSFWVLWTQFQRLLEILARAGEIISSKIQRSQIVVGFGIVRLGCNDLFERRLGLIQVAVLKECHPISEVITLKRFLVKGSRQRKRFANAIGTSAGDRW